MTQGVIPLTAGGGGAQVRSYINAALERLQTRASGTARPSDIAAGEPWFETDNPGSGVWSLWRYTGSADVLLGTFDTSGGSFKHAAATLGGVLTTQGDIMFRNSSTVTRLAAGADNMRSLFTGGAGADPAWAGTWKQFGTANPNGAGSIDFTSIPASVNHVMLIGHVKVNTDNVGFQIQTYGADGVLDTGATDYVYANWNVDNGGASGAVVSTGTNAGLIANNVDNAGNSAVSFIISLADIQGARYTQALVHSSFIHNSNVLVSTSGASWRTETDRITGVRIVPTSGTLGNANDHVTCWVSE